MAEFSPAFDYTMSWEDPTLSGVVTIDAGGRTRFGIAEAYNPEMPADFWTLPVDQAIKLARAQYFAKYFLPFHLDEISEQPVASYIFDCIVNPGPGFVKQIQDAASFVSGTPLELDGVIGPETLSAINECAVSTLLRAIGLRRLAYYKDHGEPEGLERRAMGWKSLLGGAI